MTSLTMRLVYLSLGLLFAREIRDVHSPAPGPGGFDSARWSSNLGPQPPPGSSSNPCDKSKTESRAKDAHSACRNECLALKPEISTIYDAYPGYNTVKYLHENCGMVAGGQCSTAAFSPICWCHPPKDSESQRRHTLSNCRSGIQIVRKFTDAMTDKKRTMDQVTEGEVEVEGVAMFDCFGLGGSRPPTRPRSDNPRRRPNTSLFRGSSARPSTSTTRPSSSGTRPSSSGTRPSSSGARPSSSGTRPSSTGTRPSSSSSRRRSPPVDSSAGPSVPAPPQRHEEDWNSREDGEPEGLFLCTDVRIAGRDVRAMLDTGAAFNVIHQRHVGNNMIPLDKTGGTFAGNAQFRIVGQATIDLEVKPGVSIPLTGYITDRQFDLVLGTDFYVSYFAKIKIAQRTMDLGTARGLVILKIKFRPAPDWVSMMSGPRSSPYQALEIDAGVNGVPSRVIVDTGASATFVTRYLVSPENLFPFEETGSIAGGSQVSFAGETIIQLQIGPSTLFVPSIVPHFVPTRNCLTGNDFNKQYIDVINYEEQSVTFALPGNIKHVKQAFILQGQ